MARVEHYFAEVLSRIEGRSATDDGTLTGKPVVAGSLILKSDGMR